MSNAITFVTGSSRITIELDGEENMSLTDVLAKAQVVLAPGQRVAHNGEVADDLNGTYAEAGDRVVVAGTKSAGTV